MSVLSVIVWSVEVVRCSVPLAWAFVVRLGKSGASSHRRPHAKIEGYLNRVGQ